jgi:peptidoglycan/LPS O-acetylase OafA/YrhL
MLNLRHLGQPLIIITTLAAMICAISSPQLNWLVSPILCYIGKISYSCYLIHFFMLKLALYLLNMDKIQMSTGSGSAHFALIILIALPLTVAASTLTWHLVEQPSIAAGRWFIRRIQLSIREEQPVGKLSHAG